MRRIADDDSGAVAVIVAILSIVLFGMAALVIDVGRLYEERRELQNGADAAALAVGWECVQVGVGSANCPGDGIFSVLGATVTSYATGYASANAGDGAATVLGTSEINLADGWIQVDLQSDLAVEPIFSGVLGFGGETVRASAAVETVPGNFSPITFGTCELKYLLGGDIDDDLASLIAGASFPSGTLQGVGFQGGQPANPDCQAPSGSDKTEQDAAGYFGWLDTGNPKDCRIDLPSAYSPLWVEGVSGSSNPETAGGCTEDDLIGEVYMLVFDDVENLKNNDPPRGPLCIPHGKITCYSGVYVMKMNVTGSEFPSFTTGTGCTLPKFTPSSDCIEGYILDVLTIQETIEETRSVRLIEPLPNP